MGGWGERFVVDSGSFSHSLTHLLIPVLELSWLLDLKLLQLTRRYYTLFGNNSRD